MGKIKEEVLERNQQIMDDYVSMTKKKMAPEEAISRIASGLDIGTFYVRNILKEQGIRIKRKQVYDRKNGLVLQKRDEAMIESYKQGSTLNELSKKYKLTSTRVRQILKNQISASNKHAQSHLLRSKEMVLDKIKEGMLYPDIIEKFGRTLIKNLNYQLNFNAYQVFCKHRTKDIKQMFMAGKTPAEIAKKHKLTKNYVYIMLHQNGHRSRVTGDEKKKRDAAICESYKKGKALEAIAEQFQLTTTMIRIIVSNQEKKNKTGS